jgi:uncharacterized membrane protein
MIRVTYFADECRKHLFLLFLLFITYSILMSSFVTSRYQSYQAAFYDLGIFNHDFWVRIFDSKRISGLQSLIWGGHVAPTLYLALPFYAIYPSCEGLLILQTIILAAAVFPLYLIASETLASNKMGLLFSAAYLLYPPLHWVNRADFHAQAFIPVLLLSTYFFYRKNNCLYTLFLLLTAFTIEFAPLLVISLGIYLLAKELLSLRSKKFARAVLQIPLLSIIAGIAVLLFDYTIVYWLQSSYPPLHSQLPFGYERALPLHVVRSGAGTSISFNILLKPTTLIDLVKPDFDSKLGYLLSIFGFLGFVSLSAPISLLIGAPWLLITFLTSYSPYYSITAHYTAQIMGPIFISAVLGVRVLSKLLPRISRVLPWALLALVLATSIFDSPLSPINPHTGNPQDPLDSRWWPQMSEREQKINSILKNIPSNVSVLATNEVASHLSSRSEISVFRSDIPYPDLVIVDTKSMSFSRLEDSYYWKLADLLEETDYDLRSSYDGLNIYERRKSAPILETVTILSIDEFGNEVSNVSMGGRLYFQGRAYSPKGLPVKNGRVHMFAEIDGRYIARSSTVLEWNSEPTDESGVYDTRRQGQPIPTNGPECLEIRKDGVYINGEIKGWSGNPEGKIMRVFAVVWGFADGFPPTIMVRYISIGASK